MNLFKKEALDLFTSISYYLIGFIYLIGTALFLFFFGGQFNIFELNQANLYPFFQISPFFLMILIPALTMRSFAEEKEKGTLEWLKTMPLDSSKIIGAKFASIVLGFMVIQLLSFVFLYTIQHFALSGIDDGLLFSSYLGLLFLAILLISVGVFCSSISSNQITAYILTVIIAVFFYFFFDGLADYNLIGNFDFITKSFSSQFHYDRFSQGLFYLSSFVYFTSLSALFLFLTQLKFNRK